jgi:hypothetical protein
VRTCLDPFILLLPMLLLADPLKLLPLPATSALSSVLAASPNVNTLLAVPVVHSSGIGSQIMLASASEVSHSSTAAGVLLSLQTMSAAAV